MLVLPALILHFALATGWLQIQVILSPYITACRGGLLVLTGSCSTVCWLCVHDDLAASRFLALPVAGENLPGKKLSGEKLTSKASDEEKSSPVF